MLACASAVSDFRVNQSRGAKKVPGAGGGTFEMPSLFQRDLSTLLMPLTVLLYTVGGLAGAKGNGGSRTGAIVWWCCCCCDGTGCWGRLNCCCCWDATWC